MPRTFDDMLARMRASIREIDCAELLARLGSDAPPVLLDVREPEELVGGLIPGAITVPRGYLEMRAEQLAPDKAAPVAVYCEGGVRSALGAWALQEMGYGDVVNLSGGVTAWTRAGYALERRRLLSSAERARYARQIVLPQVGEEGQRKLAEARVLCVGAGGLGCPTALYLAAAGVGTLGIVDHDRAELSNLQRQILHGEDAVGRSKVESACDALSRLNSSVELRAHETRLQAGNALEILRDYDVIVDGTDNFPTRYLINDACVLLDLPNVHGSVFHFDGQVTVFHAPGGGPCYRCLYPSPPPPELAPNCAEAGVLGAICGIVGAMQAAEAMKLVLGAGEPLAGRILSIDALYGSIRELRVRRDPACPMCGDEPTIRELVDYEQLCASA